MKVYNITIEQDESPESPREWDNLGVIVTALRNYQFEQELSGEYATLQEAFLAHLDDEGLKFKDCIVLPIYAYIHSGISLSVGAYTCKWDSGTAGYIYTTKKKARAEFGRVYNARARACLAGEIETLNQYLEGDVWRYSITDDNGEILDSCGGYYGRDYCETEAAEMVEWYKKQDVAAQKRAELNAQYIAAGE